MALHFENTKKNIKMTEEMKKILKKGTFVDSVTKKYYLIKIVIIVTEQIDKEAQLIVNVILM